MSSLGSASTDGVLAKVILSLLLLIYSHFGPCFTVWKNAKFTLTQNFSRQINYLVILLVKSLLSRNFCQKRVRVNFRNFHTVLCKLCQTRGFSLTKISWKGRYESCFHEIFFGEGTVASGVISEIYSHSFLAKISWKQHFY